MATVVQAKCPQCHKVLRIPADWLTQKVRCKHCGQTIRPSKIDSASRSAAPPPLPAKNASSAGKMPSAPPPLAPADDYLEKWSPPHGKMPSAPSPVAPVAPQVAAPISAAIPPSVPVGDNAFGDFPAEESTAPRRGQRRKRRGSWLPLVLAALFLVVGLGIGGLLAWPHINASLQSGNSVVEKGKENRDDQKTRATAGATKTAGKDTKQQGPTKNDSAPADVGASFPNRRAMIVSVHNYLYANLTHAGMPGVGGRNIANLKRALNNGLRIPMDHIVHLSDSTETGKERTPLKSVIEEGVSTFLDSCRPQDRALLFFIGHCSEVEDEPYLVPIEGELENAKTLIPLKWFYAQLEKCKARQKVFVIDVARFSPTEGRERPGGDPLSAKFETALKTPPTGVQVWTACSAEQQSWETDEAPMGLFLNSLYESLSPTVAGKGFQGKIQKANDLFPLEQLAPLINKGMEGELKTLKAKQVCQLHGKDRDNGVQFDPKEATTKAQLPKPPDMTVNPQSKQLVKAVLEEIGVPPVKVSRFDNAVHFDFLPPFPDGTLDTYAPSDAPENSKLRPAVAKAKTVLWDISKGDKEMKVLLDVLRDGYRAPTNENQFKTKLYNDERQVAKLIGQVMEAEDELIAAGEDKEKESKRWQANYDYMLARMQAQIAYLFEFQSMLGQMRKEFPPREQGQGGWRLASRVDLTGDSNGKRRFTSSRKLLDKIIKEYEGSPWEVLAKREKLTALGLDWKGSK